MYVRWGTPQDSAIDVVIRTEPTIGGRRENHAAGGREDSAALKALACPSTKSCVAQADGLEPAVTAVAVRAGAHRYVDAAR